MIREEVYIEFVKFYAATADVIVANIIRYQIIERVALVLTFRIQCHFIYGVTLFSLIKFDLTPIIICIVNNAQLSQLI